MLTIQPYSRVAVIGAGVAGAACADSLQRAGMNVVVFDKSAGVGGRMATRHATWTAADGTAQSAAFDHGAPFFTARHPRFRARVQRAQAAGCLAPWAPRVHAAWPVAQDAHSHTAVPEMPAFSRHLLDGIPQRLGRPVQRLQRLGHGWQVVTAGGEVSGPFDHVMLALPPAQAALLLAGHHDAWADTLAATPMSPCWTLMAVTNDVDWPWDAAEPDRGPLAWVARNDRKPGRSAPAGCATWVAHASTAWSAEHLEDEPAAVNDVLCRALKALLPRGQALQLRHSSVHRWRYAVPALATADHRECWWDERLSLGVCGDFLGAGDVESAWRSGDELADTVTAWLETVQELAHAA